MDILIKNMEMPKGCFECPLCLHHSRFDGNEWHCGCGVLRKEVSDDGDKDKDCPLVPVPDHNDLADKSVIIERMGEAYEALYDKVDKKALSECHVAFLKAVMYAPTVIPSTVKIPTEGIEPKGVWDETLTTEVEGERTT